MLLLSAMATKKIDPYRLWPIAKDDEIKSGIRSNLKERMLNRLRQLKQQDAPHGNGN